MNEDKNFPFAIEDISYTIEGANPFGGTSSATLKILGKVMLARDVKSFYTEDYVLKPDLLMEDFEGMEYGEDDLDVDGWQPEYAVGDTYGLRIYHSTRKGPGADVKPFEVGAFILQEIGEENGGIDGDRKFRRIGLVNFTDERDPFQSVEEITSVTII